MRKKLSRLMTAATCVAALGAGTAFAQSSTTNVQTKRFEIISVDGNKVVARVPEGTREYTLTDEFKFNVDGRPITLQELRPGMKGTATITTTTTTTPVVVTEVRNGEVLQASGSSLLVKTADGFRMFTESELEKRNVRIFRDGKPVQIADLHTGERLTATIVTEKAPRVLTQRQVNASIASGGAPAPADGSTARATTGSTASAESGATSTPRPGRTAAPGGSASLSARSSAAGASAQAGASRTLPKTASPLPLIGVVGVASFAIGIALTVRRRRQETEE